MRESSKNKIFESESQGNVLSTDSLAQLKVYVKDSLNKVKAAETISTNENLICQETFDLYASVHKVDIQNPDNSLLLARIVRFLVYSLISPDPNLLQQQIVASAHLVSSRSISVIAELTGIAEVVVTNFLKRESIDEEVIGIVTQALKIYGSKLVQLRGSSLPEEISDTQVVKHLQSSSSRKGLWERGDRMIAMTAGGAFLGGTIGLAPGVVIGAAAGAIFALLAKVN